MTGIARFLYRILLSRRAFILFGIALVAYNAIGMHLLYDRGSSDFWEHLAAMNALASHPVHPPNPYVLPDGPTHLFTPYHLLWGVVARILHIHVFWLFPFIAGLHMALFMAGASLFSRYILLDVRYRLVLTLALLFFWIDPWNWSGFCSFAHLPLMAIYPFWFALPASLLILAGYGKSRRQLPVLLLSLASGFVFLCHPLTGLFLLLGMGAKALTMESIPAAKRAPLVALPPLFAALGALAWPYFPVIPTLLRSNQFAEVGFAGQWQEFYRMAAWKILPALLGLPFIVYPIAQRRPTFASLGFLATSGLWLFNGAVLHNSTLARLVAFVAFFGQVAVVQTLQHFERRAGASGVVVAFVLVLALAAPPQIGASFLKLGPLHDFAHKQPVGTHSNVAAFREYAPLGQIVGHADVVMAPMANSWELPGVIGCRVVGVAHSNPFLSEYFERRAATEKFFSGEVSEAERSKILSDYAVDYVLVPKACETALADFTNHLAVVRENREYRFYAVP